MKLFRKILNIILAFVIGLGGFLYSLRLLINTFYKKTFSDEDVIQLIQDHILLTIIILVVLLALIIVIIIIFPKFLKHFDKLNPLSRTLSKFESYYDLGEYDKVLSAINSKSIWKLFPSYNYSIHKLAANIHLILGKEKLCFQSIKQASVCARTDDMKNELSKIKFQLFVCAGHVNGAKEILKSLSLYALKSPLQTVAHYKALILEKECNLQDARKKLSSAASIIDDLNKQEQIFIYNNLGRISRILNNHSEEIYFYEKAKKQITRKTAKYFIHVIYQNMISLQLFDNNYDNVFPLFTEYYSVIDKNNKYDLLEYLNYLLILNRQTNDYPEFIRAVESSHKHLYPLLTKDEQFNADISELGFCFNNNIPRFDLLHMLNTNLPLNTKHDLQEKLFAYKIVYNAITDHSHTLVLHPFEDLCRFITAFFQKAIPEIDEYIKNELEDFQIATKCSLLKEKVFLFNFQFNIIDDAMNLINLKLTLIDEITDIYLSSCNIIMALESELNYLDECLGLSYNSWPYEIINTLKQLMLVRFGKVDIEIQKFLKHPEVPPMLIRMAKYSSFFDLKDLAKKYWDKFRELNLSINHFAAWIQIYYNDVNNYLNNHI